MKLMPKVFLISAAVVAAVGLAAAAAAEIKHNHVLTIRLPNGSQEQILYVGDTPPEVRLQPGLTPFTPIPAADPFGPDSPFAALQRLDAQMDREAAALLQQARSLSDPLFDRAGGSMQVDWSKLPAGASGYSVVSTMSGGKVCTQTTQYGPAGSSGQMNAVTRVSGDCNASGGSSSSAPSAASMRKGVDFPILQQISSRL